MNSQIYRGVSIACAALLIFATAPAIAAAASVDWKMYGGAAYVEQTVCFYDAAGITAPAEGIVRVWTKCLAQKSLDSIDLNSDAGKIIVDRAARKVLIHYVPPIAKVETLNQDQILAVTQYEVTADAGDIEPQASILLELDCRQRKERELSISIHAGERQANRNQPSEWQYVPPEGNGAHLLGLLCVAHGPEK